MSCTGKQQKKRDRGLAVPSQPPRTHWSRSLINGRVTEGHSRRCKAAAAGTRHEHKTLAADRLCNRLWICIRSRLPSAPSEPAPTGREGAPVHPASQPAGISIPLLAQNLPNHLAQQPSPLSPFQESPGLSHPEAGHISQITSEDSFYHVHSQTYTKSEHPASQPRHTSPPQEAGGSPSLAPTPGGIHPDTQKPTK